MSAEVTNTNLTTCWRYKNHHHHHHRHHHHNKNSILRTTKTKTTTKATRSSTNNNLTLEEEKEEEEFSFGIFGKSKAKYFYSNNNGIRTTTTIYKDSAFDKLAIALFNAKLASKLMANTDGRSSTTISKADDDQEEEDIKKFSLFSYDRLVYLADEVGVMFKDRNKQRQIVTETLLELIPELVRILFKKLIKPANWVDEMNAIITVQFFGWLVGPSERIARESDGVMASVKLKKCRYLEQSGCVGSCTNFCKVPTENFFKEAFGVDAHLAPNHIDGSCMMTFGEKLSDEEIFAAPCYMTCKSSNRKMLPEECEGADDDDDYKTKKCWKLQ
jgi:hypothetical protein